MRYFFRRFIMSDSAPNLDDILSSLLVGNIYFILLFFFLKTEFQNTATSPTQIEGHPTPAKVTSGTVDDANYSQSPANHQVLLLICYKFQLPFSLIIWSFHFFLVWWGTLYSCRRSRVSFAASHVYCSAWSFRSTQCSLSTPYGGYSSFAPRFSVDGDFG